MDRYVVLGNPIAHSQSPFIHTSFARQTGQSIDYGRQLVALDGLPAALEALAAAGVKGCNVTVPFKGSAFEACARPSERVQLARAANVIRFDADGWLADNTDGAGLVADLERNAGVTLVGANVLLIGAGGAAAGALAPLLAARPAQVVVANRTLASARDLVARHAALAGATVLRAAPLDDCGSGFQIVVNATASSLQGAAIPVAPTVLAPGALALDMMYGAAARPFLDWAAAHGARGRDGLGMLVEQAAVAFEIFRGVRPQTADVLAALRERLATPSVA